MSRGAFIALTNEAELLERPFAQAPTVPKAGYPSLEAFKSELRAYRLSTTPADRSAAENGVYLAYREAGLAPPGIVWCDGPVELAKTWASAGPGDRVGANVRDIVIDGPYHGVRQLIDMATDGRVETLHDVLAYDRSCLVSAAVRAAVIEEVGTIRPSLLTCMRGFDASSSSVRGALRRSTFADSGWSQHELCDLSLYACLHELLNCLATCPLRGLWQVAKQAGWVVPHERVCWLAERPDVLRSDQRGRLHCASGPALRYRDGWARYAWKGVTFTCRAAP